MTEIVGIDLCSVADCGTARKTRGYCDKHYRRVRKYGDPLAPGLRPRGRTPEQRFWSKVRYAEADECWEWTGFRCSFGYGRFGRGGRDAGVVEAHRWAYESLRGPVPHGLHLDHLCRNPPCVNPWHLEPVSPRVNILRGTGASARNVVKTHCLHGHPYSPENTHITAQGSRLCRLCMADNKKRRRDREREVS